MNMNPQNFRAKNQTLIIHGPKARECGPLHVFVAETTSKSAQKGQMSEIQSRPDIASNASARTRLSARRA
jgi:hypothetical protein